MTFPIYPWLGLAAEIVGLGGILLSARGFRGMKQERLSVLNHFISELGDKRFAKHQRIFNTAMFVAGILFIPFVIGIASTITNTVFYIIILILGLTATIGLSLVGIFAEQYEKTHITVAGFFFGGTMFLILFFIIGFFIQQFSIFPQWMLAVNIIALIMPVAFIVDTLQLPKWEMEKTYRPWDWDPDERPRFWLNPCLEWCAVISLFAWLFIVVVLSF